MKKLYLYTVLMLCTLFFTTNTFAQTPAYFNYSGTTGGNTFPFNTTAGKGVQWLVGPNEITGAPSGMITAIYFRAAQTTTPSGTHANFTIKMGQTPSTTLTVASWINGLSTVYFNSAQFLTTGPATWFGFTLNTPFFYDPSKSLLVEVTQTGITGNGPTVGQTSIAGSVRRVWLDVLPNAIGGDANVGHIGLDIMAAPPCIGPTTGTTVVKNATPCVGTNANVDLNGNSVGAGQMYQWETANSIAGPYLPVGTASVSPVAAIPAAVAGTTYIRAAVTCGANTLYSNIDSFMVPSVFPGGTYTINNALATGSGNFATFAEAAAAINCGVSGPVTFNVSNGPFLNDRFVLDNFLTSPTTPIVINGNGATIQNLSPILFNAPIVKLNGTKYVTINNLNIDGYTSTTSQYAWGVMLTNNADFNTITNCTITLDTTTNSVPTTASAGIVMTGTATNPITAGSNCDDNVISGNTVNGGYYGITSVGTPLINNNNIINNTVKNFYSYGIYVGGSSNAQIEGNNVHRMGRTTPGVYYGTYLTGASTNVKISKNRYHDPFASTNTSIAYGVNITTADATVGNENIISNNIIYDFKNTTGAQYGLYNSGSDYSLFYHNTVSLDDIASASTAVTNGAYQTTLATGVQFKNNIFSVTRGGTGVKHGIHYNVATTVINSDYNDYYVNSVGGSNYVGAIATTNYVSLANWQAAAPGQELNSEVMNPMFANPALADLTPTNVLLDDQGTAVGILTDFGGNLRSATTPDMGGIEFLNMPLSPNLLDISASNVGSRNRVVWTTGSEEFGDIFLVERSVDNARSFTDLTIVPAKGQTSEYTYWDETPVTGINHYRLRMVDAVGKATWSKIVSATVRDLGAFSLEAYPNPVADVLTVKAYGPTSAQATVTIVDITGKTILTATMHNGEVAINMAHLSKGLYVLRYSERKYTHTLKVHKM
jgi:hypothetical protein